MIIYRLISPSGKSYIGKTKASLKERLHQHKLLWLRRKRRCQDYNGCPTKLFYAFDKYGPENFREEILFECSSDKELNDKEKYFISIYGDYNISKGGDGRLVEYLTHNHKKNISIAKANWWNTPEGLERRKYLSKKMVGNKNQMRHK